MCLYPDLILNITSLLIYRIIKYKSNAFYNNLIIEESLLNLDINSLIKELATPSSIYKTDTIKLINIIQSLDLKKILKIREI
jgi:hypothetical protein